MRRLATLRKRHWHRTGEVLLKTKLGKHGQVISANTQEQKRGKRWPAWNVWRSIRAKKPNRISGTQGWTFLCFFLSCLKVDYVHARPTSLVPISRVLSACVARLLLFLLISFFFSSGLISRVVLKVKWPYISSRRYGQIFFSLDYLIYFHECFWQIFSYELWSRKWDDTDYVLAYVLVQVLLMNKFLIFPQERVRTSNHIRVSPSSSSLSLPSSHADQLHPDHLSAVKASKLVSLNLRSWIFEVD